MEPFAEAPLKIPGVLQWTATQVGVVSLHRTHPDTGKSHWICLITFERDTTYSGLDEIYTLATYLETPD